MYAAARVAKINAWIALVNKPKKIIGIGIANGINEIKTATTNSSARILPNNRKLNERGLVKSSKILLKY
jgi:hypothetical protein